MITNDIFYVGVNDHEVDLFEDQYVVKNGMAYNSYVIMDEKVAVMDTVDARFGDAWLLNIQKVLGGRKPDYLVVQHMEPDHSANIRAFMDAYPEAVLVGNAKTFPMIRNFFRGLELEGRTLTVANGGSLSLGRHTLTFVMAPMVHWPEVMVTYDAYDKILFSADGFGKFGALDAEEDWADEARRYYIGIVGKYGPQVQKLLGVAAGLEITQILPLHGPILKENLGYYLDLYNSWSSYKPEEDGVVVAYASIYGNTKKAALTLAEKLRAKGAKVVCHDLARCDLPQAVADAFRYSALVLAAPTYNGDVFPCMKAYIDHLTERSFQNRAVGLMENGSWAPTAAKVMKAKFEKSKNLRFTDTTVSILSSLSEENEAQMDAMVSELLG